MLAETKAPLIRGNAVKLLTNGDHAFPDMLVRIGQARERISCETYILRVDELGESWLNALTAAARRGVAVRLLYDAVGSRTVTSEQLAPFLAAGGQVRTFNPVANWTLVRFNNRDHRKLLVVDGETAYVGGLNLAREYDGDGLQKGHWRDTAVRIDGPAALDVEKLFADNWDQGGAGLIGKDLPMVGVNRVKRIVEAPFRAILGQAPGFDPGGRIHSAGTVPVRVVGSRPDTMSSRALDLYLLAINSARARVWITNAYFVPPVRLARALRAAAQRGVDVRLLLQGETDEPTVRMISIGHYGDLLKSGVQIYEWEAPSLLHAKTMTVDGIWSTIGSANLDGRALFLNYESNVAITDAALAAELEAQFERDLAHARTVTLDAWHARSLKQRATEMILLPLEGQF